MSSWRLATSAMATGISKLFSRLISGVSTPPPDATTPPPPPPAAAASPSDTASTTAARSGAARMEQQIRGSLPNPVHSAAYKKFMSATRTHPVELAMAELVDDANHVFRAAMHDTNKLLQDHQALSLPAGRSDPHTTTLHAQRADDILASLKFEQDCLREQGQAFKILQRLGQEKLVAARAEVTKYGAQEAKLTPLMRKLEAQSNKDQQVLREQAELVARMDEHRTNLVMGLLELTRMSDAG